MPYACPISGRQIDSTIVRIVSFEIAITSLLLLLTSHWLFASLLFLDFSARLLRMKAYSPFTILALFVQKRVRLAARYSDESPKRFALYLGWSMVLLIAVSALAGSGTLVSAFAWVLLLCSAMEALFEYCVGCVLYRYLLRMRLLQR